MLDKLPNDALKKQTHSLNLSRTGYRAVVPNQGTTADFWRHFWLSLLWTRGGPSFWGAKAGML